MASPIIGFGRQTGILHQEVLTSGHRVQTSLSLLNFIHFGIGTH